MARINIAMLSQETQQAPQLNGDELVTDSGALEIQRVSNDIDKMDGVVDETKDAADAVDSLAEKIQAQETVSQDTIAVAQEMMAYFSKRTGVKFRGVSAAMESYRTGSAAEKNQIVKELKLASESFRGHVSVAQEGIVDRIKNRFSLIFSNADKLEKELKQVSAAYDQNGTKDEIIEGAAFARIFASKGNGTVEGRDVVDLAGTVAKGIHDPEITKIINDLIKIMDGLTLSLSKGDFLGSSETLQEIEEKHREIIDINAKVRAGYDFGIKKEDIDIKPIEQGDKDKLADIVSKLLDTKEFEKAEERLERSVNGYYVAYTAAINGRLFGIFAKDARNAELISDIGWEIYSKLSDFMDTGFQVAHASVKYIKASTKK